MPQKQNAKRQNKLIRLLLNPIVAIEKADMLLMEAFGVMDKKILY